MRLRASPNPWSRARLAAVRPAYERFLEHELTRLEGVNSIEISFALVQAKHSLALPLG